jgi:hypothetical protein
VGNSNELGMRFRLETGSEIVAQPAYKKPFVYVASVSGELFAMQELTGVRRWKYATGFPVTRAAAAVGERVFVSSEEPALHCIGAVNGNAEWEAPRVAQFAAISRERVYGVNDLGALVVLDAAKGTTLGRLSTGFMLKALVNDQTDRVYLVSDNGLVECLHEIGVKEPLYHNPKQTDPEKPEAAAEGQPPATTAPAETSEPPAETEPEEPAAPVEPMEEREQPAGEFGVGDENPFGE